MRPDRRPIMELSARKTFLISLLDAPMALRIPISLLLPLGLGESSQG
ncbi:MAG: hypothetical protein PUI05_06380 [Peptoniphilaceae bacterium]|nr:hypothetical protein [Peptoniphilaceae bacterium]